MQTRGKVVLVGVLDKFGSTNIYMAKAFQKAGFDVVPVNYRTILAQHGPNTLRHVIFRLAETKPQLMLFSKCNGFTSDTIGRCNKHSQTWWWFMDGMNTLNSIPEVMGHAQLADHASCTGFGVAAFIKKQLGGQKEIHHIMEGIDPEVYRPTVVMEDMQAEISFIGTNNAERHHYLNLLATAGFDVAAYGQGFNREVHGSEFNKVCTSSKSMLALSVEHSTEGYFSDRVFRYGACGSMVLHKYSPRMEKYFQNGHDIVFWHDDESLLQVAQHYLRQEPETVRETIGHNLYKKVLANHTWDNVVRDICSVCGI